MRYLVLSDVHANLEALTAVLEASAGEWDQVLVLGYLLALAVSVAGDAADLLREDTTRQTKRKGPPAPEP